jgi:hypothetical protein
MIGQKHESSSLGIAIADATQSFGIGLLGVEDEPLYFLVAEQPRAAIDWPRVHALEFEIGFGAGGEEAGGLMEAVEPLEVEVAAVHDVEGAGLGNQYIEDIDVVQFAVGNVDKTGIAPRKSSSGCSFTAALVLRNLAHGNSDKHKSMVVASRA